jgi:multicomponent Na+:H+ antiporter subunit E
LDKSNNSPTHRNSGSENNTATSHRTKRLRTSFFLTWVVLFAFWIVFSGKFDWFHITFGMIACTIVALITGDSLFSSPTPRRLILVWLRFVGYIPWLFYQIFKANLHVLSLVFHPKMMEVIDPKIIEFDSRLISDISRTTFANSITLTPGTITVNVSVLGKFTVHCIDEKSSQSLPGHMETKIARVFDE